jgi:hypothetical protein
MLEDRELAGSLRDYIEEWLATNNMNWDSLIRTAGLPNGISTSIKKGSLPQPKTLRSLARAMRINRSVLFRIAGYLEPEDYPAPEMLSAQEQSIVQMVRELSPALRRVIVAGLQAAWEQSREQE